MGGPNECYDVTPNAATKDYLLLGPEISGKSIHETKLVVITN